MKKGVSYFLISLTLLKYTLMDSKNKQHNPKITTFNSSVINSKSAAAKRATAARSKGTIKGMVSKMTGR
jgi:hypothetical protein